MTSLSPRVRVIMVASTALLSLGLLAAPATAQYGLGDGHALDANPQVGSAGRNVTRVVEDFRARNRIVTGEVGDGREFRGEVGYVGERAFTAPLPSDSIFRFQADSAASSIQSILSGASLDRFNLAASGGVFAFDRDFTAPAAGSTADYGARFLIPERVGLDAMSRATGLGRVLERSASTSMVGSALDESGNAVAVLGSPVTGLRFERMLPGQLPATDLPLMDFSALTEELRSEMPGAVIPGEAFRSPLLAIDSAAVDSAAIDPGRIGVDADLSLRNLLAVDPSIERLTGAPDYDSIVRRVIEQYGIDPTVAFTGDRELMLSLNRQLEELRERLQQPTDAAADLPSIRDRMEAEAAAQDPPVDPAPAPEVPDPDSVAQAENLMRALRHGRTVEELTPVERTRLGQMIARGEEMLAEEQFMLAERHFDRALRFVPKHPMALAGLVNAQIGAGLHLSAAVNLHQLLAGHPEMIDVRYGERILPPPGRLELAVDAMRRRLASAARADQGDYGLLLAFIGHQTGDRARVAEGLSAVRRADPDSSLLPVLEAIWLAE